ncbi:10757_t:CDS:2 [Paraglomus brasilianum]|uniref:10757_t:CDS:1 n=1 Tax=Paraglomus brasilianum TaxID=144538 RepID=A0A9N9FXW4_9GLOM|nr:10757_t:CDS:2 [Paraglomus brasilianum]
MKMRGVFFTAAFILVICLFLAVVEGFDGAHELSKRHAVVISHPKDPTTSAATPTSTSNETIIDPNTPQGAIQMVTPAVTANKALYKIGSKVTFSWKYSPTPVLAPKNLTMEAQANANKNWYPIANLSGDATSYVWDSSNQSPPLLNSDYTLWIYDERGRTPIPSPGRLTPFSGLIFSMYSPEPYTDYSGK